MWRVCPREGCPCCFTCSKTIHISLNVRTCWGTWMLLKDTGRRQRECRKGHSAWGRKGKSVVQEAKPAPFSICIYIWDLTGFWLVPIPSHGISVNFSFLVLFVSLERCWIHHTPWPLRREAKKPSTECRKERAHTTSAKRPGLPLVRLFPACSFYSQGEISCHQGLSVSWHPQTLRLFVWEAV